ncbi:MAG: hypothetical protein GEU90_06960, partial [Gemmatimonas sp.]|nr:hypothetical protein [Gemmatimonas sp.]
CTPSGRAASGQLGLDWCWNGRTRGAAAPGHIDRRGAAAGISFVAPLPEELQHRTSYEAAVVATSAHAELAATLISFLASDSVTSVVESLGLERLENNQ